MFFENDDVGSTTIRFEYKEEDDDKKNYEKKGFYGYKKKTDNFFPDIDD